PLLVKAGWNEEARSLRQRKAEYFSCHDWTTQISLRRLTKFDFWRTCFLVRRRGAACHLSRKFESICPTGNRFRCWLPAVSQLLPPMPLGSIHTQPARPASAAQLAGTSIIARSARSNAAVASAPAPGCPDITAFRTSLACAGVVPGR